METRSTSEILARIAGWGLSAISLALLVHVGARFVWIVSPIIPNTSDFARRTPLTYSTDTAGHIMSHGLALSAIAVMAFIITIIIMTVILIQKAKERRRIKVRSTFLHYADTKEIMVQRGRHAQR